MKKVTLKEKVVRFSISIPPEFLTYLDKLVKKGYSSRSEAIRDLIRAKIAEEEWKGEKEVIGILTILYDHTVKGIEKKLTDVQHVFLLKIHSCLHIHLTKTDCMEIIILRGKPVDIEKMVAKIVGVKGVKYGKVLKVAGVERLP